VIGFMPIVPQSVPCAQLTRVVLHVAAATALSEDGGVEYL
jgi:hypothetical protein